MDLQPISIAADSGRGNRSRTGRRDSSPSSSSSSSRRSVKRKADHPTTDAVATAPVRGGESDAGVVAVARVEVENEVSALRSAVASQQETIEELLAELEEERNAAATAASETMSMILRLQSEKAELEMEARNFRRFAEEKMAHDQDELDALEELLYKRDEAIHYLTFQVEAYRHRLLSYGIDPDAHAAAEFEEYDELPPDFDDVPVCDYPPLKCTTPNHGHVDDEEERADCKKYAVGEIPPGKEEEEEENSEPAETTPAGSLVMEIGVVQHSPDNLTRNGLEPDENGQKIKKEEEIPVTMDRPFSDKEGADDMTDRVCMIDMVYRIPTASVSEDYNDEPKEKERKMEVFGEGEQEEKKEIKKLYLRLQALEEDGEVMRQAIVSMRSGKAQLALLKEMAQQLRKEVVPERRIVKNPSTKSLSLVLMAFFKWIVSFFRWRKRASRSKYTAGLSSNNIGLMLLLDKSPQITYWRCLNRSTTITMTSSLIALSCSQSKIQSYIGAVG